MRVSFLFRIVTTILLVIGGVFLMLGNISSLLRTHYNEIATIETKRVTTLVVTKVIHEEIASYNSNHFILEENEEKVSYNVELINRLLGFSSQAIYNRLKEIENGTSELYGNEIDSNYKEKGIIYEMPFSVISDNVFLSSLGPKIPIKFSLLGSVETDCISNIESFGINNALVSLEIVCKLETQIVLPLSSSTYQYKINIPFAMSLVEGKVPSYYLGTHTVEGVSKSISEVYEI